MKTPSKLYRYRPLADGDILTRELDALRESYLYAPPFSKMNDPMEAFYETGGPDDQLISALLAPHGKRIADMYDMISRMIDNAALVSFAGSHDDLPMWAYYGSNFSGMCLEFDTEQLKIGDFQDEKLCPVTYAEHALPPLTFADIASAQLNDAVISRITRKRTEWAHEKEWRFLTGEVGPKHYLDDALRRVFLGPKIEPKHEKHVCEILERRPVEVLKGELNGFELTFRTLKAARPIQECERVGRGSFEPANILYKPDALETFLSTPLDVLLEECRRTQKRPNLDEIIDLDVSVQRKDTLFVSAIYRLRNGRDIYHKHYFDREMRPQPTEC